MDDPTQSALDALSEKATQGEWEYFCDRCYFDMWCVRKVGERTFGAGFHVMTAEEARGLHDLLNATPDPAAIAAAEARGREAERADVAAWLRASADAHGIPGLMDRLDHIALAIERRAYERGEHLTKESGQ